MKIESGSTPPHAGGKSGDVLSSVVLTTNKTHYVITMLFVENLYLGGNMYVTL